MPRRTDIQSILVIGAGPIIIGQASEFDYSGTQAVKALKEEGYRVVLVNSNPATIMTDPEMADATYVEPITPEIVAKIIAKERPDALLPTMGGQTALNCALKLEKMGVLAEYGVEMIGAKADAIDKAENRQRFREAMDRIGLESARSGVANTVEEAFAVLERTGLPAIIRPSFTLGGTGGGIAYNKAEFEQIVRSGLDASPTTEVLIEESLLGWKEFEMEVVRDRKDNAIIICSIENVDPMGVHTGDSITVAPALTLTDKEYQIMRSASIAVLREIGVETGGSNVQFAVDPKSGRLIVIEMNPRVSRSSALASKATGFPIARIAAKLAVGYTLDELTNEITGATPAAFEPTIDYVVTKIPRFAFEKFKGAKPELSTAMKSVGEVMAIGRCFAESMQKALRGLETGLDGFNRVPELEGAPRDAITAALSQRTPDRILKVAQAFREDFSVEEIHSLTGYDRWFLRQIEAIIYEEKMIGVNGIPTDAEGLRRLKAMGFSDRRLATLAVRSVGVAGGLAETQARRSGLLHDALRAMAGATSEQEVRKLRHKLGVLPVFKRIDSCAAEFEAITPYMYSTYEAPSFGEAEDEADPSERRKIVILGGGPNRIGQGIEFDYCCVHACFALSEAGFETIMVNCNPETVSTDYDTSDRLYFEPLTEEDVLEILRVEMSRGELVGVIVQLGGQTPLKLAAALEREGIPILGTSPDAIDLAEDRERFARLVRQLELSQPRNGIAKSRDEAAAVARTIGYPVLLRPSYVLGGRAMEIVDSEAQLDDYIATAVNVSGDSPVLVDQYLRDAIECDVDVIADAEGEVRIAGVMQHIEEAGVHSGDSACTLPPYSLPAEVIIEMERQAIELARALKVQGLMNVQFALKQGDPDAVRGNGVFLIEVNPRASRTVPFVAKAIGRPVAKIAARVMAGEPLSAFEPFEVPAGHISVKEAVFPFARFPGADPVLSPEMKSTGEVMGIDRTFPAAFLKSQLGAGMYLPNKGKLFVSVKDTDKAVIVPAVKALLDHGFTAVATGGTQRYLAAQGLDVAPVNKVAEGRPHIVDAIIDGEIALIFNTTEGWQSLLDSQSIRASALEKKVPYYTTASGALAVARAITEVKAAQLEVRSLQAYYN
jgi:carbamoyl-phosphate synthase large subunit